MTPTFRAITVIEPSARQIAEKIDALNAVNLVSGVADGRAATETRRRLGAPRRTR